MHIIAETKNTKFKFLHNKSQPHKKSPRGKIRTMAKARYIKTCFSHKKYQPLKKSQQGINAHHGRGQIGHSARGHGFDGGRSGGGSGCGWADGRGHAVGQRGGATRGGRLGGSCREKIIKKTHINQKRPRTSIVERPRSVMMVVLTLERRV